MKSFGIAVVCVVAVIGLWFLGQALWFGNEAVNSAHGVVHKTLDPNHVLFQYEHFHDLCHDVLALNQQIVTAQQTLESDQADNGPDPLGQHIGIVSRDRSNVEALKNQRDNAAQAYNSDSHKLNDSIFKSRSLPYSIDPPDYVVKCELRK